MRASAYLAGLTLPLLVLASLLASGVWTFLAPAVVFGVLPALEWLVGERPESRDEATLRGLARSALHTRLLHLFGWLHLALLGLFCWQVSRGGWTGVELAGWIASAGTSCGSIAINVAHELGHRRRAIDRRMALALLHSSFYPQFFIEHNRGHHVHVGTEHDAATAPRGMSVYRYFLRTLVGELRSSWRLGSSELLRMAAIQVAALVAVAFALTPIAAAAWVGAGLVGVLMLQTVAYVEHYGLRRERGGDGELEPIEVWHSWNSDHLIGRLFLFELPRHSDHHAHAARPYQCLRSDEDAPRLPGGYPMMMVLASLPPLWFRVMDPRAERTRIEAGA